MWPNQRSPYGQPDEYQAMQQMRRAQELQQLAIQQPGTGWAGAAMALIGGWGGRRMEERAYDRLSQLQTDRAEQERMKREMAVAALSGGDMQKAAAAFMNIPGMEDAGLKMLADANKPEHIPDALWARFTPESIGQYTQTRDPAVLKDSDPNGKRKGLPPGYQWAEDGSAERIPGLDDYFSRQTKRASSGGASTVINLPNGQQAIKPTTTMRNAAQGDLVAAQRSLESLGVIGNSYADDYLTYGGKASGALLGLADKAGIPIGQDSKDFLAGKRRFGQQVEQAFNQYRVAVTGAAASEKELQFLRQTFLNSDLSPTEFQASFQALQEQMARDVGYYQNLLQAGIPVQEAQDLMASAPFGSEPPPAAAPSSDASLEQRQLQGDLDAVRGTAPNAEAPPVPGARKAPDGKWYVQQGGEWFEVEG